jgi:fatty-acyl-CoA synthase
MTDAVLSDISWPQFASAGDVEVIEAVQLGDRGLPARWRKPYKLALRADAASVEIIEALAEQSGIAEVHGPVVNGSVQVTVTTDAAADLDQARAELGRFAVATEVFRR